MPVGVYPIWLWVPALESACFPASGCPDLDATLIGKNQAWQAIPVGLAWTAAPKANTEVLTMKRFRLRLSWLLWLVAIAAAFLAGVRYEEYRAGPRRAYVTAIDLAFPVKPINSHARP
jgi:hypothetical protein